MIKIKVNSIKKLISILLLSVLCMESVLAYSGDKNLDSIYKQTDNLNFLGIKKSKSAKILDDFKEKQQILVFENVPFSTEDEELIFDSDNKLNSLEDILKRIEKTKDQYKEKKREVTKQKITLKNTIEQIDDNIEQVGLSIKETQEIISEKNKKINELSLKINELSEKINVNKELILNYLSYIYSKGDLIYGEDNDLDIIRSIILNDGNLSDIINDIHFKTIIELSGQNLIEIHRNLVKEFYFNKESLKKEKIENLRLKKRLENEKNSLTDQKTYKEELLNVTKGQEALFNKYIFAKQEREDTIKNKIEEVNNEYNQVFSDIGNKYNCDLKFLSGSLDEEEILNNLKKENIKNENPKCKEIKKYFVLEQKLRNSEDDLQEINPLSWPVKPSRGISTFFHDEDYFTELGSEHEAIDIPVIQSTDIVAPVAGYVYFVNPPYAGGYGYIAIKHASGFVTIYGHISEVYVKKFDFIEAGEVFAKSGGAPGTAGAGPMTTGPHLHFEVYKDRISVDPLRFLDLTNLNFDNIGTKYRYKYIEDLKIKYGNRANISKFRRFYIVGENEIERQKYLLNKYATADFNDWNIWVEEGMNGKIDPSFLMCIGLAETGLGKNLKTSYNVGNVGNTDSGSVYQFDNPREGIYWMAKTLNNKFLKKYTTINMLSRWGNKNGSIYASSNKNWHNNIVKCLSSLKGRFIEDDYQFRVIE